MFIGHFAVALGAKKYAPAVSLGVLFLACQLADLLWPTLVFLGVEIVRVVPGITAMTPLDFVYYPFSHSLLALVAWSTLVAGGYAIVKRSGTKSAIVIGIVVLSHWILDVVTHRPDLPLTLSGSLRAGLGLWNYPAIAVPLELLLFVGGFWIYSRRTRALDRIGTIGLWGLGVFLIVVYAANVFGPPPPSPEAVVWSAQAMWLIVALGFWIDRHRTVEVDVI